MNKQDKLLILIVFSLFIIVFAMFKLTEKHDNLQALVYYENTLIKKIDLNTNEKEYIVKGYNGNIKLIAGNGKIKVSDEISPLHLCSKMGYISKSYEQIVCLPNKIIIKIDSKNSVDTIVE